MVQKDTLSNACLTDALTCLIASDWCDRCLPVVVHICPKACLRVKQREPRIANNMVMVIKALVQLTNVPTMDCKHSPGHTTSVLPQPGNEFVVFVDITLGYEETLKNPSKGV